MRGKFSFLAHYLEIALKQARVMLPGVRRMDAFYHSSETEPLTALTSDFSAESEEPLTLVIDGKIETLEKLINLKSNYSWYSEDELPYCKNGDSNKIPDVFSELNKTVLMVRFTREKSTQKDALVVYFKENMIGFGMNLSQKEIKSDYKDIIAQMVNSLSNTKSNNSNYFFEGKTEIIRSKVSNTYLVFFEKSARIFELVIVYLNNFIRILTSQKFSEVAFEVVVSGQNNLIPCGLAKRSNVNVQLFSVALNYLSGNPGRDHLLLKSLNESVKAILQSVDNLLSDLLTKINKIRYHLINKNPFTLKNMYLPHIFNQEGDHPGYS